MDTCIFCKIIAKETEASVVYEDDKILVFADISPVNIGHTLIIPKKHAEFMKEVDDETISQIIKMAKKVGDAIRKSGVKCEGINLFVADGEAAEQEIPHFHLHVYPRFKGDDFGFRYDDKKHFVKRERQDLDDTAEKIRKNLQP